MLAKTIKHPKEKRVAKEPFSRSITPLRTEVSEFSSAKLLAIALSVEII
ncbi:MAG: hypothetical protein SAK29_07350 [Scytonema sp. PMC 1069.18]|nr:hypothetical protein [Scytonema sp. PMC 1069.18]MEC4886195.1 hypothetical protein [Scytonema sp. PMC 1070.18]